MRPRMGVQGNGDVGDGNGRSRSGGIVRAIPRGSLRCLRNVFVAVLARAVLVVVTAETVLQKLSMAIVVAAIAVAVDGDAFQSMLFTVSLLPISTVCAFGGGHRCRSQEWKQQRDGLGEHCPPPPVAILRRRLRLLLLLWMHGRH